MGVATRSAQTLDFRGRLLSQEQAHVWSQSGSTQDKQNSLSMFPQGEFNGGKKEVGHRDGARGMRPLQREKRGAGVAGTPGRRQPKGASAGTFPETDRVGGGATLSLGPRW